MRNNKLKRQLQLKQKLISKGNRKPSNGEGRDGDLTVRFVQGQGMFLFYKWAGKWYGSRMKQYSSRTSELKEPVKLPIGKTAAKVGELTFKDGTVHLNKAKGKKSRVLAYDVVSGDNVADASEIDFSRSSTTGMSADNAGTSDLRIINKTGHASLHIKTESSDHDPFIILSHLSAGETADLKQWVIGMDNSASDTLKFCRKGAGTEPLTPSTTSAGNIEMQLTTGGNLTVGGTITDGSGNTLGAADITGVTLTGDSGGTLSDTAGSADFTIAGGTNCSTSGSGSTITINADAPPITALNSATANELVTVGATTTELDAETNATFDGNTLSITNTQLLLNQAMFKYDGSNHFGINVIATGASMLTATGDITFKVLGNCTNFSDGTNTFGEINVGTASTFKLLSATDYALNLETSGTGDINILPAGGDILSYSLTASKPTLTLDNRTVDASGPSLIFNSQRGHSGTGNLVDAVDNDVLGDILFTGYDDGTPSTHTYAKIRVIAADTLTNEEKGNLAITISSKDGNLYEACTFAGNSVAGGAVTTTLGGPLYLKEPSSSAAEADVNGYGQIWVKDRNPNELWFTDDGGNDFKVAPYRFSATTDQINYRVSAVNTWYAGNQTLGTSVAAADFGHYEAGYAVYNSVSATVLKTWRWHGGFSSSVDYEVELWDVTMGSDGASYASAAAKVGDTQSISATSSRMYTIGQTDLSYDVAAGHQLYVLIRYTSGSGSKYTYGSVTLEMIHNG